MLPAPMIAPVTVPARTAPARATVCGVALIAASGRARMIARGTACAVRTSATAKWAGSRSTAPSPRAQPTVTLTATVSVANVAAGQGGVARRVKSSRAMPIAARTGHARLVSACASRNGPASSATCTSLLASTPSADGRAGIALGTAPANVKKGGAELAVTSVSALPGALVMASASRGAVSAVAGGRAMIAAFDPARKRRQRANTAAPNPCASCTMARLMSGCDCICVAGVPRRAQRMEGACSTPSKATATASTATTATHANMCHARGAARGTASASMARAPATSGGLGRRARTRDASAGAGETARSKLMGRPPPFAAPLLARPLGSHLGPSRLAVATADASSELASASTVGWGRTARLARAHEVARLTGSAMRAHASAEAAGEARIAPSLWAAPTIAGARSAEARV
jgi:hypothetical protein